MSSAKFIAIAKNIVKTDKDIFDTLMDFEQTKRIRTKNRLNFTIDKSVASRFKKFCREKGYNMSARVEQAMNKMLESN